MGNAKMNAESTYKMINSNRPFTETQLQIWANDLEIINFNKLHPMGNRRINEDCFRKAFEEEFDNRTAKIEQIKKQIQQEKKKQEECKEQLRKNQRSQRFNEYNIMENSKLEIMIIEAKNLPAMNLNQSADPFVVITVNNEDVFTTEVAETSLSPQ